nr:hypothetical protein CFP56_03081 [Quercus suber]
MAADRCDTGRHQFSNHASLLSRRIGDPAKLQQRRGFSLGEESLLASQEVDADSNSLSFGRGDEARHGVQPRRSHRLMGYWPMRLRGHGYNGRNSCLFYKIRHWLPSAPSNNLRRDTGATRHVCRPKTHSHDREQHPQTLVTTLYSVCRQLAVVFSCKRRSRDCAQSACCVAMRWEMHIIPPRSPRSCRKVLPRRATVASTTHQQRPSGHHGPPVWWSGSGESAVPCTLSSKAQNPGKHAKICEVHSSCFPFLDLHRATGLHDW